MTFMIRFLPKNIEVSRNEPAARLGEIILGDYVETFEASTSYWTVKDYQNQWSEAIERIVAGEEKSCLITSMYDPESTNFIFWWPLYREGGRIFVQNQVLFLNEEKMPFNSANPYASIKNRQTLTEDGNPISEWEISIEELEQF